MIPLPTAQAQNGDGLNPINTEHTAIITDANHFARRLTAPCSSHARIIFPKRGCPSSQSCNRREPRAAQ